jgi:hypothetical protein
MKCVMCSPWNRTFTLAPLARFVVFSPIFQIFKFSKVLYHIYIRYNVHVGLNKVLVYDT